MECTATRPESAGNYPVAPGPWDEERLAEWRREACRCVLEEGHPGEHIDQFDVIWEGE
jgi:hypothetical protein